MSGRPSCFGTTAFGTGPACQYSCAFRFDCYYVKVHTETIEPLLRSHNETVLYQYNLGFANGKKEGVGEGGSLGLVEGRKQGLEEGRVTFYEEGKKAGIEEGKKIGERDGFEKGFQEGEVKGYQDGYSEGMVDSDAKLSVPNLSVFQVVEENDILAEIENDLQRHHVSYEEFIFWMGLVLKKLYGIGCYGLYVRGIRLIFSRVDEREKMIQFLTEHKLLSLYHSARQILDANRQTFGRKIDKRC